MGKIQNSGETLSVEAMAEVEIMQEIDRLFRELEAADTNEDRREELARDIRQALERYHHLFRKEDDAKELLRGYYKRLDDAMKTPAA